MKQNINKHVSKDDHNKQNLHIDDFLTQHRSKILYDLRVLKKSKVGSRFKIAVRSGTPCAIVNGISRWIQILCAEDIKNLANNILEDCVNGSAEETRDQ